MQSTRHRDKRNGGAGATVAVLILGLFLLAGVFVYSYKYLLPHIESDIGDRVTSSLAQKGIANASVEVQGTDVILSGNVESDATAIEAEQAALAVYGVTGVTNKINQPVDNTEDAATTSVVSTDNNDGTAASSSIEEDSSNKKSDADNTDAADSNTDNDTADTDATTAANDEESNSGDNTEAPSESAVVVAGDINVSSLEISVRDGIAVLTGVLPDTSMSERLSDAMTDQYGAGNVSNDIAVEPETLPPLWLDSVLAIIDRLNNIDNPTFKISEGSAALTGNVSSETLGAQQLSAAKRALGNDIEVSGTFNIVKRATQLPSGDRNNRPAKKRPPSLRIASTNDSIRLTGTISSVDEAGTVRSSIADLFGNIDYTDELIIDDSVSEATWLTEAIEVTRNVQQIDNFSVSINSDQMMLSGDVANRETGKTLAGTAARIAGNKLDVVNNYSVNQTELIIESREDILARELTEKLFALDTAKIVFNPGSAVIATEAMAVLDQVAETLSAYSEQVVEISGHTDTSGDTVANLELSKKRAIAVRDYLVSKGLPSNQLRPIGYGESKPVADNSTPAGRAANRRIEFNL